MKIYLDKEGLTYGKRKSDCWLFGHDWKIRRMYRAVFSDGSSCSCCFGITGDRRKNEDDERTCHGTYGIGFFEDDGKMSEEAWDFARKYAGDAEKFFKVPGVDVGYGLEPDFDRLDKLGEAHLDRLRDSMTEWTERGEGAPRTLASWAEFITASPYPDISGVVEKRVRGRLLKKTHASGLEALLEQAGKKDGDWYFFHEKNKYGDCWTFFRGKSARRRWVPDLVIMPKHY